MLFGFYAEAAAPVVLSTGAGNNHPLAAAGYKAFGKSPAGHFPFFVQWRGPILTRRRDPSQMQQVGRPEFADQARRRFAIQKVARMAVGNAGVSNVIYGAGRVDFDVRRTQRRQAVPGSE